MNESTQPETRPRVKADEVSLLLDLVGELGLSALERETVAVSDLKSDPEGLTRSPHVSEEGFFNCFGVPLVAKGHVNGVLGVFHRTRLYADEERLNYLETVAGPAAIAIDNAKPW